MARADSSLEIRHDRLDLAGRQRVLELDAQGRVAIPTPLRKYAGIDDVAVVAGVNTYFEIWSRENWEAESDLMENEAWQISEGIEERT